MNAQKFKVNTELGMLKDVPRKKPPLQELLDWIREHRGLSANQLAERSGAFTRSALSMQAAKDRPNPGLDMIHGIASQAKIPEQVVMDACLGRPFLTAQELEDATLKEILRKCQMIKPENRSESLEVTLKILSSLIDETLDAQDKAQKPKR